MQNKRHLIILKLIREENIGTQEDLALRLREEGIDVTQATISRDIKKLGLIKVPGEDDRYYYSYPGTGNTLQSRSWLRKMIKNFVIDMDYSENIILIKCVSGMASGLGVAVDNSDIEGIMGTVAGDDTLMVVVKPSGVTPRVFEKLSSLL
ncbi:MAG: arginine repressor [Bacillota bacterium]